MKSSAASFEQATRFHLMDRASRAETPDGESRELLVRLTEQAAIARQPQLAEILHRIALRREPGFLELLKNLGSSFATSEAGRLVCGHGRADAPANGAKWWHVSRGVAFVHGEIFAAADAFIEETRDVHEIRINSHGGDCRAALKIAEAMQGRTVRTVCTGRASSAAFSIFMMGETRIMQSGARLMTHAPRSYAYGTPEELRGEADTLALTVERLTAYYTDRTGWPAHTVRRWFNGQDHWFDASQAVAMGLAHEITEAPQEAEAAIITTTTPEAASTPQGNESLFLHWLEAFGDVRTMDRAALNRELVAWFAYHIKPAL